MKLIVNNSFQMLSIIELEKDGYNTLIHFLFYKSINRIKIVSILIVRYQIKRNLL